MRCVSSNSVAEGKSVAKPRPGCDDNQCDAANGIYTKVQIHGSNGASVGVQTDTGATFVAGVSGITQPPPLRG
jgi:hypothetical protein